MFSEDEIDTGTAFYGEGIAYGNAGMVQLWNPPDSGKYLYLRGFYHAVSVDAGALLASDFRKTQVPFATEMLDNINGKVHISNALIASSIVAKAQIRYQVTGGGAAPPTRPPFQELWIGANQTDHYYRICARIDPGWGLYTAGVGNGNNITSWAWREKSGAPIADAITSDLTNPGAMFDGDQTTFAEAAASSFFCGKTWGSPQAVSGMTIKSPSTRSLSGGSPGRNYTWFAESFDGTSWSQIATGTYTETVGAQSVITATFAAVTANGHRMRVTESAVANHRIAEMTLT